MEQRAPVVLGLSCSPRKKGNTDLMCDSALEGAAGAGATVEKVHVPSLDINPCKECNACFKEGVCVQKDDMAPLIEKMLGCEGIILAAPIFSMNLAAQAKAMIDRLQCCWARHYVLEQQLLPDEVQARRRGLWLSAAGFERDSVFEPATATVKYFFHILEVPRWERIAFGGIEDKGAIRERPGALEDCAEAGARLVEGNRGGGTDG
ncbi:MAG TPA: flavodoxin family protein [Candidatus Anoxymicrobiaceae bacterium]|jgi:multimeric flavodoxin WrbA